MIYVGTFQPLSAITGYLGPGCVPCPGSPPGGLLGCHRSVVYGHRPWGTDSSHTVGWLFYATGGSSARPSLQSRGPIPIHTPSGCALQELSFDGHPMPKFGWTWDLILKVPFPSFLFTLLKYSSDDSRVGLGIPRGVACGVAGAARWDRANWAIGTGFLAP